MAEQTVFVVEDDELIANLLQHLLEREGLLVQQFADGRLAQQAIHNSTVVPSLILLDVMLPYLDGFALVKEIRQLWHDVPIVMLTAKSQETEIVRALDAGANDYVIKPFQVNELMARLRRFLRRGAK